jgi:hypothetical protein
VSNDPIRTQSNPQAHQGHHRHDTWGPLHIAIDDHTRDAWRRLPDQKPDNDPWPQISYPTNGREADCV